MSNSPKISLIIPAYMPTKEHLEMTIECLESLQDRPDEVIVVNDGSPIDLIPPVWVDYLRLPENRGFAGAVNAGLERATGDILMQANNDIMFTPGWLEGLVKPLEMGYDISSIRTTDNTGYELVDEITEGDKFGSIWAITRQVYETLGGLDERFGKGYFEDLDYRRRALDAGFRIAKNHGAVVEHRGHATFDTIDPDQELFARNRAVFIEKHGFIE